MNNNDENKETTRSIQLVTFSVGQEEYGVHIEDVEGVIRIPEITHLPQTESFLKGVINLRGDIIPVIDMRERFNMESVEYSQTTRVINVKINEKLIGLIVDTVSQVITMEEKDIEDTPDIIHGISKEYIEGIGKYNDLMIIILKIEKILTADEFKKISKATDKAAKKDEPQEESEKDEPQAAEVKKAV